MRRSGTFVASAPPVAKSVSQLRRTIASLEDDLSFSDDSAGVVQSLARLAGAGALALPHPAAGNTASRFDVLAEIGALDLSLARLAEGHVDAIAILAEAGRVPYAREDGANGDPLYGVWAAEASDARVEAARCAHGWVLRGKKRYASGARGLGRALVTAHTPEGVRLLDVDLRTPRVRPVPGTWQAVGMAATESLEVGFDGVEVPEEAEVGGPGFYLARPGFWFGAVGVAACWYGGALGAFRMLRAHLSRVVASEHQSAHLGAVAAECTMMKGVLAHAARAIDADPSDRRRAGRANALVVRQLVERGCQEVLQRVGRASGSAPLAFDRAHARRAADLVVYLRQHHAERDLAALGHAVLEEDACL